MSRTCSHCNKSFSDDYFIKRSNVCKSCRSIERKQSYAKKVEEHSKMTGTMSCTFCEKVKDISFFTIGTRTCIDCTNEKRRTRREIERTDLSDVKSIKCPEGYKICKNCKTVKKDDEFRPKRLTCRKCGNLERVAYKNGLIDKYERPTVSEPEDDFAKRLKASCRIRIRETLPKDYCKTLTETNRLGYIYELLDCDMGFLKKWLRYNYGEAMNDETYGTVWTLDHVMPIHKFDTKNESSGHRKLCYSWFNVSPFGTIDNSRKNCAVDKRQLEKHISNYKKFCAENQLSINEHYLSFCATHLDAGTS